MKKFLIVFGVILCVFTLFSCSADPDNVAVDAMEAMFEADADDFVDLCSDSLIEDMMDRFGAGTRKVLVNTMEERFEKLQEEYDDEMGDWDYDIEYIDSKIEDDMCIVYLEVTLIDEGWFSDDEQTETFKIYLVREDGDWRLDSYPNF